MDKGLFLVGMKKLGDAHPERLVTEDTMEVYWERLQELPDEEFQRGVAFCLDNLKYFPKISEILEAALTTAREAWAYLIKCAEKGADPCMDTATINALDAIGGWEVFQFTDYKDLKFMFKDFKEAYDRAITQQKTALPEPEKKLLEG